MSKTVFPTYSCFTDAMELAEYVAKHQPDVLPSWRIVHALCETQDGTTYAHAWVEDYNLNIAIFAGILNAQKVYLGSPLDEFYKNNKIKESTKYTMSEVLINNATSGHFGPWEKKYRDACNSDQRRKIAGYGQISCFSLGSLPQEARK